MEAVRQRDAPSRPVDTADDVEGTALPPPPAPFPTELLPGPSAPAEHPAQPLEHARDLDLIQRSCVAALTALLPPDSSPHNRSTLSPANQHLAAALTELLEATYELDHLRPSPAYEETDSRDPAHAAGAGADTGVEASFDALTEHLTRLAEQTSSPVAPARVTNGTAARLHPAIHAVRAELAWARVQSLSRAVLEMVHERDAESEAEVSDDKEKAAASESHPPEYDETPPVYAAETKSPLASSSSIAPAQIEEGGHSEKMMRELDDLTQAIVRLNSRGPRYADQRSELRPRRSAHLLGSIGTNAEAGPSRWPAAAPERVMEKQRMPELEEIWRKIERAHGKRRMRDQDVDLEAKGERRMEQVRGTLTGLTVARKVFAGLV
jgi:hypothetical protein